MASGMFKWILGHLENSHYFRRVVARRQIDNIMTKKVSEYSLRHLPLIKNPKVEKILNTSFNNTYGGIHLLVAPPGSGKSTYLRSYANQFIGEGGRVQFFASELQTRKQFFESFGNAKRAIDLFEVIPKQSVIIIDKIEHFENLNEEIKSLLKHLAYESRRVSGVSVIVSTASVKFAQEILRLNGHDKIRMNGAISDWRWTPELIDKYIASEVFLNLTDEQKLALKNLACKACCPAFLYSCADLLPGSQWDVKSDVLSKRADKFAADWEVFERTEFEM